jgi:hypothetical protein
MFGTLASVTRLAGLMETIEQDDSVFMELDRSPVSFDLADLGSPSARLGTLSRTLDAHLQKPSCVNTESWQSARIVRSEPLLP